MNESRDSIVVIGAGIGGLAAAAELSHAGLDVTVLERAAAPGGKMRTVDSRAGPVDAGPTVFTMAGVFDALFAALDEVPERHLTLRPLDLLARHHWRGAPALDLHADPGRSRDAIGAFAGARAAAEFDAFNARAARLFAAFDAPVMRHPDPTVTSVARATMGRLPGILGDMAAGRSLAGMLGRAFSDPRLAQLFARYATYVGGSPYLSPAILALIWHAEAQGVATVRGGMAALARALEGLATARGARFRYGCGAARIEAAGGRARAVITEAGERLPAAAVLFNGDPAALGAGLLGPAARPAGVRRPPRRRSLSAWVWTFAGDPDGARLAHHNVYFSDDYRAEFAQLFGQRRTPADPTLYLCAQDRGDGDAAPGGAERFQILMNAPADGDGAPPTEEEIRQCGTRVFTRLAEAGVPLSRPGRATLTTASDFAALFPGSAGALYGTAPHGSLATLRRPRARSPVPGLYLCGGAVHPGPGVPMAALSGRLAAAAIMADRASTYGWTPTAMPGGTSTGCPTTGAAAFR